MDAKSTVRAMLEERRRQERLRSERAVVGVVLLKCIRVAYRFRQCSPQRTIASAAASQQVWYDAMQCTDMRLQSSRRLSQGSPNPNPLAHPPRIPISRSGGQAAPASARQLSSCAPITRNTSHVDHSTPPQVPPSCIPDTLAFTFLVAVDIRLAGRSSILPMSCVSSLSLSPTAPSPSARYPHAADNARCAIVSHHYGTPTPRNGFACQPRSCILNPAIRATSASWSATRPALPSMFYLRNAHHHVPGLI